MISVILPCAGKGTRLGLPYPKEIHRICEGQSLIDFSLAHATAPAAPVDKVVTVVAPGKEIVGDYVAEKLDGLQRVERVYFNDAYSEWPGSIKSAEMHFGEYNIALLPDSVLETDGARGLARQFKEQFDDGADLVFAYVPETNRQRLKALGALEIVEGKVITFCDKPAMENPSQFSGFWASFGFSKACAPKVLDFMMRSVARDVVDIAELQLDVRAFPVANYTDLGTWPSIAKFLETDRVLAG